MDDSEVKITVRPIEPDDYEAVLSLSGNNISHDDILSTPNDLTRLCFVAEVNNEVVGFNLARRFHVGIPLNRICVIQGIVVDDKYRRLGIGEKLVEAVFEQCANCGIGIVRALVEESDLRLRRFIEHLGFEPSNVINYDMFVSH